MARMDIKYEHPVALSTGERHLNKETFNIQGPALDLQSTAEDQHDMQRLGKEQVLKRRFGFWSLTGFSLMFMATWEGVLAFIAFGLGNGGPSGLIYTFIATFAGFTLVAMSLAEMASLAPTAGGQYHWVSGFAAHRYQRLLSYLIGWLGVMAYQTSTTIGTFYAGTLIQGLVILNCPTSYDPKHWHGTLIAIAITVCLAVFNIFAAQLLSKVQYAIIFLHVAGFLATIVTLWSLVPRLPSDLVWNNFIDGGGWGSVGLACLIGMLTNAGAFLGSDSVAHMSEETRDASRIVPRVMLLMLLINGSMGFVMMVTFCYTMGDIDAALLSPTGYSIIEVFHSATGSKAGANGLTSIAIILGILASLEVMAGSSRQLFAFARDKGTSRWLDVPVNSVLTTAFIACVIHCINIGSTIAFNIILSIGTVAFVTSYLVSIGCILWRRLAGPPLSVSHFSLGKAGVPINVASIAFLLIVWVMAFFPPMPHPPLEVMNWAIVLYGGVLTFAAAYYFLRARARYEGPVAYVRKTL